MTEISLGLVTFLSMDLTNAMIPNILCLHVNLPVSFQY